MMDVFFAAVRTVVGDDETINKFREAVIQNKFDEVKRAIEEKVVDINADLSIGKLGNLSKHTSSYFKGWHSENSDSLEYRAIHWAARLGHIEMLTYLCTHGANINCSNFIGNTALHVALFYGQKECVKILLDYKADVNIKNSGSILAGATENFSPLHYAVMYGDTDDIKLLVEKGANVMVQGLYNITPLFLAVRFGNLKKAKLLLSINDEVNISESQNGDTPLHSAIHAILNKTASTDIVLLLLQHQADPNAANNADETPLEILIKNSTEISSLCLESAVYLLQYGANYEIFKNVIYQTMNYDFSLDLNHFLIAERSKRNLHGNVLQDKEELVGYHEDIYSKTTITENINTSTIKLDLVPESPKPIRKPPEIREPVKNPHVNTVIKPGRQPAPKVIKEIVPVPQKTNVIVNNRADLMGDLIAALKERREAIEGLEATNKFKDTVEENIGSNDWSDYEEDSKTILNTSLGR